MGNIVQCCHTLSNYFKCKDGPARGEPERSPLLSSEESECESPSVPDDLEDDLLTVSTGVTNPTLEPENFLFPDIILSSNLGGDVTLVEPMVCLLVSEEEEGVRADEPADEVQERSNRWRSRGYSEVETQTEVETQIGMGVQTQTESQAHTETHVERDVNAPTNTVVAVDVCGEHELHQQVDVQPKHNAELKKELHTDVNDVLKLQQNSDSAWTEYSAAPTQERAEEQNREHNVNNTEENIPVEESQPAKYSNDTEMMENSDPDERRVDVTQQSSQDDEQTGQTTVVSGRDVNDKDFDVIHSLSEEHADQSGSNEKRDEEDNRNILEQHDVELETVLPQVKVEEEVEEAERKQMTLFSVDRLFLAAPHVKGVSFNSTVIIFACIFSAEGVFVC